MANLPKLCVICGEDCGGQPRTKDAQGRYYHNECYERARGVQEDRAAPGVEPGPMNLLDEIVDDALGDVEAQPTCASCGHPLAAGDVICLSCGFNAQSGEIVQMEVKKRPKASAGGGGDGLAARLLTPFGVNAMAFLVIGLLIVILFATESVVALAGLAVFLYAYMLAASVVVLVVAFMESVTQGLLTLCVPFYVLYFVFVVTENQWARWLYLGSLLLNLAIVALTAMLS